MTSRTTLNGYCVLALSLVLTLGTARPAAALDITFNGRNLEVLDTEALAAFAVTPSGSEPAVIPLSALYPWLESVESVRAQSGSNRVYWEASELSESAWYEAALQRRDGVWEIRIGRDVFSAPDRIAVQGVELEIDEITIWSAVEDPQLRSTVESILAFRDVRLAWRRLTDPEYLLNDPPSSGLPHLVLTGPLGRGVLDKELTSWLPVSSGSYAWYGDVSINPGLALSRPLAADAYHPEAALFYLALTGGRLFDDAGLTADVEEYLIWAAESKVDGRLVITDEPVSAVRAGAAPLALLLPSGKKELTAMDAPVPVPLPNSPLANYLAIPTGLGGNAADIAALLLEALSPYLTDPADPMESTDPAKPVDTGRQPDPRLPEFFAAYERIGRLVISGQMSPADGMDLMNRYIASDADDG